jgi:hypothetical protein
MVAAVAFFQALIDMGEDHDGKYAGARDVLWKWVVAFPMKSNRWSGYYEDVGNHPDNYNQQLPLETARFMLRHPDFEAQYKQYVPALIEWARDRFGQTRQFGATSIREQDCCFYEMSSHTARYASVAAKWFGVSGKAEDREEARASFAVATYSVKNKFSKGDDALNYVGIGYTKPWFSDSYFDYLTHIIEGMAELPEMSPADQDHLLGSTSVVQSIKYAPGRVRYRTRDKHGCEILRLSFTPKVETKKHGLRYEFGEYRGVSNVLRVWRAGTDRVSINRE